jgi:hypothetical protein
MATQEQMFDQLKLLIQEQSLRITQLEQKYQIQIEQNDEQNAQLEKLTKQIPQLQAEIESLKATNITLTQRLDNQQGNTTPSLNTSIPPQSATTTTTTTTTTTSPSHSARPTPIPPQPVAPLLNLQPPLPSTTTTPLTPQKIQNYFQQLQHYINTRSISNTATSSDVNAWLEYLYLNLMRNTQFVNTSNTLIKTELSTIENWLHYLESQISSQYDLLVQMQARTTINKPKRFYISYHKYLELQELFPAHFSTPPTYDTPFPDVNSIFRTHQQRQDDELVSKQQQLLLLEQQHLHENLDNKKAVEFQAILDRQNALLTQTKLTQQPFTVRSGLALQLQTSQPPDEAVLFLQQSALGFGLGDKGNRKDGNNGEDGKDGKDGKVSEEEKQFNAILSGVLHGNGNNKKKRDVAMGVGNTMGE